MSDLCCQPSAKPPAQSAPSKSVAHFFLALWRARLWLAIGPIRAYQKIISPLLPLNQCRFEPTCSGYAVDAIRQHGLIKGSIAAAWRIARCHPFGGCGLDPAEDFCWFWQRKRKAEVKRSRLAREAEVERMAAEIREREGAC